MGSHNLFHRHMFFLCLCVCVCADAHQHDGHVLHPAGGEVVVAHVKHMQSMLLLCYAHSNVTQTNVLPKANTGGGGDGGQRHNLKRCG